MPREIFIQELEDLDAELGMSEEVEGYSKLDADGHIVDAFWLKKFLLENADYLKKHYNCKGTFTSMGTSLQYEGGEKWWVRDNNIEVYMDIEGYRQITLPISVWQRHKDIYRVKVFYSNCGWIDIHITKINLEYEKEGIEVTERNPYECLSIVFSPNYSSLKNTESTSNGGEK